MTVIAFLNVQTSKRENINLLFLFVLTALGNHIGSYYYLKSVE